MTLQLIHEDGAPLSQGLGDAWYKLTQAQQVTYIEGILDAQKADNSYLAQARAWIRGEVAAGRLTGGDFFFDPDTGALFDRQKHLLAGGPDAPGAVALLLSPYANDTPPMSAVMRTAPKMASTVPAGDVATQTPDNAPAGPDAASGFAVGAGVLVLVLVIIAAAVAFRRSTA